MNEHRSTAKNIGTSKEGLIRARASFDAFEYIALMRKKSPDSLKLGPDGELAINTKDGEVIFNNVKAAFNLTPEEMMEYIAKLAKEIKIILYKPNSK